MFNIFIQFVWTGLAMIAIVIMALFYGFMVGATKVQSSCPTYKAEMMV